MQSSMPVAHPLYCLIEGESSLFIVEPKEDVSIVELKELIHEECKNGVLRDIDAKDLTVWKVRMIMGQRHHN